MLSQIGRKPLSDKSIEREVYALSAGIGLGLVNLASDGKAHGLADLELDGDEALGANILKHALSAPLFQIASNAGKDGSVIVSEVSKNKDNYGYNAKDDKFEDLVLAGIVDPTKVARSALQNAASAAGMFLTTEAVITDIPKPEGEAPAMGGGMPGMGMGGGMPMM